jgi:bifunctional DNA-binding transcriptional regulator/antitoxin component of YhaV-PrlF toxin-antitoxin module
MSSVKEVSKVFLTNKISATLIIPIELARRHGLNEPSHVIVEETPQGILIRKLEV